MSTQMAVQRRFKARREEGPTSRGSSRWVVWDGLVGKTLSRLIVCEDEVEAEWLAARLNTEWRKTVLKQVEALAEDEDMAAYIEGITGQRGGDHQ